MFCLPCSYPSVYGQICSFLWQAIFPDMVPSLENPYYITSYKNHEHMLAEKGRRLVFRFVMDSVNSIPLYAKLLKETFFDLNIGK